MGSINALLFSVGYFLVVAGFFFIVMKFAQIVIPSKRPSGPAYKNYDSDPPDFNPDEQLTGQMVGLANEVVGRNI